MAYSGLTQFYKIPYMKRGDYITEEMEERRATIIDNLLYVSTYGASKGIVEDCRLTLSDTSEANCRLVLSPISTQYVFLGIVNYRLAYLTSPVTLELARGYMHYVYASYSSGMETDPEACVVEPSTSALDDTSHLLLAVVDYTGGQARIVENTDKEYLTNINAHTTDSENPHGQILTQNALRVVDSFEVKGRGMPPCVFMAIESGGTSGTEVELPEGFEAGFVSAMPSSLSVGSVACSIDNGNGTVTVFNSGEQGLEIRLRIDGAV